MGFIAQNPGRWATMTAMMQSQNNFTTELLAFYMRGVTLTLHGTTNIIPFNLISVKRGFTRSRRCIHCH